MTTKPIDRDEFIARLKTTHPLMFDLYLDQIEYTKYSEPVKLVCLYHGDYTALPKSVLRSKAQGYPCCPDCAKESRRDNILAAQATIGEKRELRKTQERADRRKRVIAARSRPKWNSRKP